jgi:hypothetical protein
MDENTFIVKSELNTPTLQLWENSNKEILRFEPSGDIYLRGKLIENDIEVVDGFHTFLKSQGYNFQNSMIGKVKKLVESEHNDMELGSKIRNLFKSKK